MDWVSLDVIHTLGWADVVRKSSNRGSVSSHVIVLPLSKKSNDEVSSELPGQNLGEEVDVGDKGTLQDDGDVGSVEELDWVWLSEASHLSA